MGDAERSAPHGEVARQSHVRGVRYRLSPRESLPRCWIGGGRMHLLDEITHPTRAIGEVAAPVAVVAQPFGYGGSGPGWVGLWLMRQSSMAAGSSAVTSPCNSADRRSTRVGFWPSSARSARRLRRVGRRVGAEPGEELLGDLVEGGELYLAEHVVRRAAQGVLVAQDRVAQLGRRRVQDAAGAGGRGLRAVAPEDAGQDVLGGRGVQAVDAGEAVWLNCSVGEVDVVLRSSTGQSDIQGLSGLGAGRDHVRRVDREACAEWMVVAYPSLQGRPSRRLSRRQLTHPTPTYLAASCY